MKNILVPTDFSPESRYAFDAALQLAQRGGGQLLLLHCFVPPTDSHISTTGGLVGGHGLNDVYVLKSLQAVKRRMHELMAQAHELAPEVPVHELVLTAEPDTAITETIRERDIDLVVLGTHENTSWTRFFLSSHTEQLMREAPCPVLTVKHPVNHFDVRHLVFASDFSAEADQAVPTLHQLLALFPAATLHLLDVVPAAGNHAQALEAICAFAARHQFSHYEPDVFDAPRASTGIPRFAEQAHADLVVMLTHGRSALSHLLQGSISEAVALHAAPPVLTVHV
ncbi:universal stress protein [Hymenobacter actinosclerus]|uniref:Nucleotide-binding universal stress protein, UspA family n=1 Tax=Hymenobacter actinosclerus TaxID=82805 RepID=A0A1I0BEA2_9BACT|nr:universal stress protein [Hymenobacter actinosclerus]SET05197.1 Nucleotide-binding universal stress protein, UspA family [Hymenobacter actinosclerus]